MGITTATSKVRRPAALPALTTLLKQACSGELAAALAYRGHWKSLPEGEDRTRIQEVEAEEWHHRSQLKTMLAALDSSPSRWLEARAWLIGRTLGLGCHVAGWFAPMFGAGRLESHNIREYELAARLAARSGRTEWTECLLTMAEVEWEHERFFRERVLSHRFARHAPLWTQPPPKASIRSSFDVDLQAMRAHASRAPVP